MVPQMLSAMDARMGEFTGAIAVLYASHFTADELRQLTAFYRGPVGQKFLQIMPTTMQDSMTIGQKFGELIARRYAQPHDRGAAQARSQDLTHVPACVGTSFAKKDMHELKIQRPHRRSLDLQVLQLARHRHRVFGKPREPVLRQVGAAGIADQHARAGRGVAVEEGKRAGGGVAFVEQIADQDHVVARRVRRRIGRAGPRLMISM